MQYKIYYHLHFALADAYFGVKLQLWLLGAIMPFQLILLVTFCLKPLLQ